MILKGPVAHREYSLRVDDPYHRQLLRSMDRERSRKVLRAYLERLARIRGGGQQAIPANKLFTDCNPRLVQSARTAILWGALQRGLIQEDHTPDIRGADYRYRITDKGRLWLLDN